MGPALGGATENWFAYVLALIFLVFRPQGLFGEKIIERVSPMNLCSRKG
jgi:branched-chain amino acid transport system permease protein